MPKAANIYATLPLNKAGTNAQCSERLRQVEYDIYTFREGATRADVSNYLNMRHAQLSAMLSLVMGDGTEALDSLNDEDRSNYMWLCSTIADECKALSAAL